MSYRCPECKDGRHLWREVYLEVTGWEDVDDRLEPTGERGVDDLDVWDVVSRTDVYGCSSCDWRGPRAEIQRVGLDGEPLPEPIPGQLEIA